MNFLYAPCFQTVRAPLVAAGFVLSASICTADVGIGTETPEARLHIVGESAQTGEDLRIENLDPPQTDDQVRLVVADEQGYIHTIDPLDLSLNQGEPGPNPVSGDDDWRASLPESTLTIDSAIYTNNRVGIGVPIPAYELDIEGDIRATGSLFASNHVITHATFATSDRRFKRDISSYDNGLEHIRAMQPKRFRYTENVPGAPSDREFYGLIAQEAARIDPNLVHRFKVPSPDNQPQPDPSYLGVDSQRLVFTLISAVKALDEKDREIDALRARVEALETQASAKQPSPFQRVAQAMSRLLPPAPSDRVSTTRWNAFLTQTNSSLQPRGYF